MVTPRATFILEAGIWDATGGHERVQEKRGVEEANGLARPARFTA